MRYISDIEDRYRRGSTLTRLLMINAGLFILIVLLEVLLILLGIIDGESWTDCFYMDRHPDVLLRRPWTIVTYMFTSSGLWNLLLNLITLYWFGKIFDSYFTSSQLRGLYIMGALAGMLFYLAIFTLFPSMQQRDYAQAMPGASTAILAIASATAFRMPDHIETIPVVGQVRMKYMTILLALTDIALLPDINPCTDFAHLGAVLTGFWFSRAHRRGHDITIWTGIAAFQIFLAYSKIKKIFRNKR